MSYFSLSNGEKLYYEDTGKGEQTIIMITCLPCFFLLSRIKQ